MSKLLDQEPRAFSKYSKRDDKTSYKLAQTIMEVLGDDLTSIASLDDMSKLDIITEAGTARNLDRIRLEDSIYESSVQDLDYGKDTFLW